METPLHTFHNTANALSGTTLLLLGLAVLLGLGVWLLSRSNFGTEWRSRVQLLQLILGLAIVISICTAILNHIAGNKLGPVEVYADKVVTPYGEVAFKKMRGAYIHQDMQRSSLMPQVTTDTTYLMVIEEHSGKTHVFSESHYPIGEMIVPIRAILDKEKKAK